MYNTSKINPITCEPPPLLGLPYELEAPELDPPPLLGLPYELEAPELNPPPPPAGEEYPELGDAEGLP